MIVLFTDFGNEGPYLGQMISAIYQHGGKVRVVSLFSDAPRFNSVASSFLLSAYSSDFPKETVFLCVVDPGVGTDLRKPVIVRADSRWYVGPDNGLFNSVALHSHDKDKWMINFVPERLSNTFHG